MEIGSVETYDCDAEDELEEAQGVGDDEEGEWVGGGGCRGRFPGEARATEGHGWWCCVVRGGSYSGLCEVLWVENFASQSGMLGSRIV